MARRMLLTSNGITNETQRAALLDLLGRPFAEASVVYIPTAATADSGDHAWLVSAMAQVHGLGWREFDVLELNGEPVRLRSNFNNAYRSLPIRLS